MLTQKSVNLQEVVASSYLTSTGSLSYHGGRHGRSKYFVSDFYCLHFPHCNLPTVLPYRRHIESINQLDEKEKIAFADILSRITRRYDNLFSCSFAYSMGIHQRPVPAKGSESADHENNFAHLHLHFEPPLLRSATVKKFLVGCVWFFSSKWLYLT